MPIFSFRRHKGSQIPLSDESPRSSSNGTAAIEPVNDAGIDTDDPLDLRDHDAMIQDTIRHMRQNAAPPKNLFGVTVTKSDNGRYTVAVLDEVRLGLWLLLIIAALIVLIFLIVVAVRDDVHFSDTTTHSHGTALIIAGVFCILSCLLSGIQIYQHYRHWTHPPSQRLVVRILLMVIIYSVSAWLALWQLEYSTYIDFVRVCYEAYTLYTFMVLLTQYLGGHAGVVEWMQYKEKIRWILPLNCLPKCAPTSGFLWWIKYSCLQYAVVAPIAMFIAVICEANHVFGDGEFDTNRGYLYVTILINVSQVVSLYTLAWLYVVMRKELLPFNPVYKFLVIKSVVFFTFWQGVGLAILVKVGAITDSENFSVGQVQVGLQDFIISVEMFLAAIAHKYTFGADTYADGSMALLMEQRATFIAQLAYKRAVELARRELEERDRQMAAQKEDEHGGSVTVQLESPANKDELIKHRAKEILREQNEASETVLFDSRAIAKSSLPQSSTEYSYQHQQHATLLHALENAVANEMIAETRLTSHRNGDSGVEVQIERSESDKAIDDDSESYYGSNGRMHSDNVDSEYT